MLALLRVLEDAADAAEADPCRYYDWLPGQDAYLRCDSRAAIYRTCNQAMGKTTVGLYDVHMRCIGEHPFTPLKVPDPPVEWWIVCASWPQSLAIQQKFHDIAGSRLKHGPPDPKNGYDRNRPIAQYDNGSIVRFKTTGQKALDLAGATITGGILFDEPPKDPSAFEEARKRLTRTQGLLRLTMTPIGAPVDWLRELVEAGQITDIHYRLTPENLIPVGRDEPMTLPDGTPMDQAWIDDFVANTLPHEVPVRCHGEWETRVVGNVFRAFDPGVHVTDYLPGGEVEIQIGIDYGTKVGKQVAILVAVKSDGQRESVHVLDESVADENSTNEDDARAILSMLARHGLRWQDVAKAHGDRIHMSGHVQKKSNQDLMREIAREMGVPRRGVQPRIRTVKRGAGKARGSVDAGCRYIHQQMLREGSFTVSPRCENLTAALERWDYRDDDWKDKIDALRYCLWPQIYSKRGNRGPAPELRIG